MLYIILNNIFYAQYHWNEEMSQLTIIQSVIRTQNDIQYNVTFDTK